MMYLLDTDGGFYAGDPATGYAGYGYPTSHWSNIAKKDPRAAARGMIAAGNALYRNVAPDRLRIDAKRFWDVLLSNPHTVNTEGAAITADAITPEVIRRGGAILSRMQGCEDPLGQQEYYEDLFKNLMVELTSSEGSKP